MQRGLLQYTKDKSLYPFLEVVAEAGDPGSQFSTCPKVGESPSPCYFKISHSLVFLVVVKGCLIDASYEGVDASVEAEAGVWYLPDPCCLWRGST